MPMKILWVSSGQGGGMDHLWATGEQKKEGHPQGPLRSLWAAMAQFLELLKEMDVGESSLAKTKQPRK